MPKGIFKRSLEHKKNISISLKNRYKTKKHPWSGKKHGKGFFLKISGENNKNWKGNNVSYQALHNWVARHRGRPAKCEVCNYENENKRRYFNWANKSGKYLRDLNDWIRLCVPCHRIKDKKYRDE